MAAVRLLKTALTLGQGWLLLVAAELSVGSFMRLMIHIWVGDHRLRSGTKIDPILLQNIQNNTNQTRRVVFLTLGCSLIMKTG